MGDQHGGTSIDLRGRAVLVTGGTRGIGRQIADGFAAAGAEVTVCGRNAPEANDDDAATGTGNTPAPRFVAADIRDPEQAAAAVDAVVEQHGHIDVVVNNAGGSPSCLAADASPRFISAIVGLNLLAPFYVAQRANAVMQSADGGHIINIGSVAARQPVPGTAAYAAAKAGLTTLTRALATEWAPKVRVNQVTVGLVETEQAHLHYGDASGVAAVGSTIPMQRMANPADVTSACLMLCSPMTDYINGAELLVDGGGTRPAWLTAG